jgi:hypothetical protein
MQIHELTRRQVKEDIGSELAGMAANAMGMGPAQTATRAATGLTKQGYGAGYQPPSAEWKDKYDKIVQDPAVKQYVAGLAKAWIASQQAPVKEANAPTVASVSEQDKNMREAKDRRSSKLNWRKDALKSVGASFDPSPPARAKPGQMPASVASSKQGKLMLKAYGKPRGGIQDVDEAPQEYTTPGGIIVPGSTKTDATTPKPPAGANPALATATPSPDTYGAQFVNFTDAKLASKIPGTYETVTMDMVRKLPGIKGALDKKLANVESTVGTPQHAYNVEEYLKVAVAGVQAVSQQIKNEKGVGATPGAGATTLGLSTQQIFLKAATYSKMPMESHYPTHQSD